MPPNAVEPRRVRGRHLLLLDLAGSLVGAAFAVSVLGPAPEALWPLPLLIGLPMLGLVWSGVYSNARPLADASAILSVVTYVTLAALAATLLTVLILPLSVTTPTLAFIALEEVAALVGVVVARMSLRAAGTIRYAPVDEQHSDIVDGPIPPELQRMLQALAEAHPVYQPSRFWESLGRRHLAFLGPGGEMGQFKRTLNTSYFQFGSVGLRRALPTLIADWVRHPDLAVLTASMDAPTTRWVAVALALYANAVRNRPFGDILSRVHEPEFGRPIVLRYDGLALTEDLCHSVEEFGSIMSGLPAGLRLHRVLELGAGYGRLAYVFLIARPDLQYHVVDIPPALYVSQRYLTAVTPSAKVFPFRRFERYEDVAEEMAQAKIVFLEPQQLELLPDGYADLFLTVSTLHEMRADQIRHYLALADRLCAGAFYSKQWRRFYNHLDEFSSTKDSYPIPRHWTILFDRSPLMPRSFFETLYLCQSRRA
jgi:putative sugar O-methyltransferase